MTKKVRNSILTAVLAAAAAGATWYSNKSGTPAASTAPTASTYQQGETDTGTPATSSTIPETLQPDELASMPAATPVQMLRRKAYVVSYNSSTRIANWVGWCLTAEHTRGDVPRPQAAFHEDPDVPRPRAHFEDYRGTGWTRGHMCPAGDNKWDADAMYESFLMTNITPQHKSFNAGEWNEIEKLCRKWARRYGEVYIVTGPILDEKPVHIGRAEVTVPKAFFKAVLRLGTRPATIAFICSNDDSNRPWRSCATTVDDAETRAGIDLFPALPDDIEAAIEATYDVSQW